MTTLTRVKLGPRSPIKKAPGAAKRGSTAHRHGREAEAEMDLALEALRLQGRACVAPVRPLTAGPPGKMVFKAPAPVDRVGWWVGHDEYLPPDPVAFDIKNTTKPRLECPGLSRDGGKAAKRFLDQIAWLESYGRCGIAFFAVRTGVNEWWAVDVRRLGRQLAAGEKVYLNEEPVPGVHGPVPAEKIFDAALAAFYGE